MKASKSCGSVPAAADAPTHLQQHQQDAVTAAPTSLNSGPAWLIHPKLNPTTSPAAGSQCSTSPAGSLSSGLRGPPSSQSTGNTPGTCSSGQGSISPAASILPSSSPHAAGGAPGGARAQQALAARSRSHQVLSAAQGSHGAGPSSSSTSSQTLSNPHPGLQPEAARALQQQLARSFAAARILEGGQCKDHPAPKASRAARLRRSRTSHAVLWSLSNGAPRPLSRSNSRAASRQALGRTRGSVRQLAGVGADSAATSLAAAAAAAAATEEESDKDTQGVTVQSAAGAQAGDGSGVAQPGSTRSSKEQDSPAAPKEGSNPPPPAAAAAPAAAVKAPAGVVPAKSAVTLSKVVVELPASGSATHGAPASNSSGPEGPSGGSAAPGLPSSTNGSGSSKASLALVPDTSSRASRKVLIKHRATASNATAALAAASTAADVNSSNGAAASELGGSSTSGSSASGNGGAGGEGSGRGAGVPASPTGTLSSSSSGHKLWSGSSTVPGAKRPSGLQQDRGVSDSALLEGDEAQGASAGEPVPAAPAALPVAPKPAGAVAAAVKGPTPSPQQAAGGSAAHSRPAKKKKKGFFWCCSVTRFSSDEEPVNAAGDANSQAQAVKQAADAKGPVLPELDFQKQQDTIMVGYVTAHSTHTQSTESVGEMGAEGSASSVKEAAKGPSGPRALLRNLSERAREGRGGKDKEGGSSAPLGLELPPADKAWRRGSSMPATPAGGNSGKSQVPGSGSGEEVLTAGQLAGSGAGEPGTLLSPGSPSPGRGNNVTWGPDVSSQGGALQAAVAAAAAAVKQERLSSSSNSSSGGEEGAAAKAEQVQDSSISSMPAAVAEDEVVEVPPALREIHQQPWQQHLAAQRAKAGSPCNKIPLKMSARSPASTARSSQGTSARSTPRSSRSPGRGVGHVTLTVTPGATIASEAHPGDTGVTLKAMAMQALQGSSRCTIDNVDGDRSVSAGAVQGEPATEVAPAAGADSCSIQPPAPCNAANSSSSSSKQPDCGNSTTSSLEQSNGAAPALSPAQQLQQVAAAVAHMQQANATRRSKSPPRSAGRAAGGADAAQQAGNGRSPRLQQQPWHTQQQQDTGAGAVSDAPAGAAAGAAVPAPATPAVASVVSLGQLAEPRAATKSPTAAARRPLPAVAQLAESPCTTTLHLSDLVGPASSSSASRAAASAKEASRASFSTGPVQPAASSRSAASAAAVALIQAAGSSLAASIRTGSSRRLSAAVASCSGSVVSSRRTTCSNLPGVEEVGSLSGGAAALRRSSSSLHGRSLLQLDPVGVAAAKFKVPEGVVSAALDSQAPQLRLSEAEEAVSFRWLPHARLRSRSPGGGRGRLGMAGVRGKRGRFTRCTLRSDSRLLQSTHNFRSFAEADVFLGFADAAASSMTPPSGTSRQASQLGSRPGSVTSAATSMPPISSVTGGRKGAKSGRSSPSGRVQQRSTVQQVKGEGAWRHPLSPRGGVDCKQSPRGGGAVSAGVAAAMLSQLQGQQAQQRRQVEQQAQVEGLLASTAAAPLAAAQQEACAEEVSAAAGAASPGAQHEGAVPTDDLDSDAAAAAGDGEVSPAAASPRLTDEQQGPTAAAATPAAAAQPATPVRTPRITPQEVTEPPQEQEAEDAASTEAQGGAASARVTRVTRGDSFRVSGEAGAEAVTEDAAGTTADAEEGPETAEDVEEVVIASIDGAITALAAAPAVVARLSGAGGRLVVAGPSCQQQQQQGEVEGQAPEVASSTLHTTFNLDSLLAAASSVAHHDNQYPEQQQAQATLHATGGHSKVSKAAKPATAGRAGPMNGSSPTRASIKGPQPLVGGALSRHSSSVPVTSTLIGVPGAAAAGAGGGVAGVGLSTGTMRRISAEQRLQSIDREALRRSLPYLQRGNADVDAEEGEHAAWSTSGRSAAAGASARGKSAPKPSARQQLASTAVHVEGSGAAGGGRGGWSPVCRSPVPAGVVDLDSEEGLMQLEAEGQQWLEVLSQTSHDSEVLGSLYSPARRTTAATTSAMSTRRSSARRSSTAAAHGATSTRMSSTDAAAGSHVQQRRRRSSVGAPERRSSAGEGSPERRLSKQESYLRMLQANLQHRHQQQAEHFQQLQVQQQGPSYPEDKQEQELEQLQEQEQEEQQQGEEAAEVQHEEELPTPADPPVLSAPADDLAGAEPSGPAEARLCDAANSSSCANAGPDPAADASDVGQASQAGLEEVEAPQQQEVVCEEAAVDACSSEGGTESCGNCSSFSSQGTEWEHEEAQGPAAPAAPAAGASSAGAVAVDTGKDWEVGEGECDE